MSGKIRTQREKRAAIRLLGGMMALGALPGVLALSAQPASAAPCYGDCKPGVIRAAGLLKYDAPVGADDQITVTAGSGFVTVTDPAATFTAGAGCVMVAAHQARCDNVWGMKIRGLDGNDVITNATTLPSTLDGGGGNDHLVGGSGDDVLTGGFGADNLQGGGGNDTAGYDDFSDRVAIQVDLDGAAGDDGGPDDGPAGLRDTVGVDVENVTGSGQNDVLTGNAGPNVLDGAGGHDQVKGLGGDDRLIGRGGGTLDGGANTDDCTSVLVTLDPPDTFVGCESTHVQS